MQANKLVLFAAATAFLAGASISANAAEKLGKPLETKPSATQATDNWRERAMRAQAMEPDGELTGNVPFGTTQAIDDRGDRMDGEEAGNGGLRKDEGGGSRLD